VSTRERPGRPLGTGGRTVPAEWIDYNGHMMDAYYFLAFTEATEALLDHIGLGAGYRAETGCGMYTAESHLCFHASVPAGAELCYSSQLLGCDAKRLHVFHRMTVGDGPEEHRQLVRALAAEHAPLPRPAAAGRRIAMPGTT